MFGGGDLDLNLDFLPSNTPSLNLFVVAEFLVGDVACESSSNTWRPIEKSAAEVSCWIVGRRDVGIDVEAHEGNFGCAWDLNNCIGSAAGTSYGGNSKPYYDWDCRWKLKWHHQEKLIADVDSSSHLLVVKKERNN